MKTVSLIIIVALSVGACAGPADKLLSVVETFDDKHMETVAQRARVYCVGTTAARQQRNRDRLDVADKGPVVVVHCDRF